MDKKALQKLIAQKIMGQTYIKPTHGYCCTCSTCGHHYDDCLCKYYTEEIADAWLIIDKMKELGFPQWEMYQLDSCVWFRFIKSDDEHDKRRHVIRSTAPEAIVYAALDALGIAVEE